MIIDSKSKNLDEKNTEQEERRLIISELSELIKRMTYYAEQHSKSNTVVLLNTLKATIRYRDSLAECLARETALLTKSGNLS